MSDLTITHGGVSVSKRSGGEVLSNNKKLNQMKVDVIDVDPTHTVASVSNNYIFFSGGEIENAVSVKGGSCILQSITLLDDDNQGAAMDIIFSDAVVTLGTDAGAIDIDDGTEQNILGIIRVSDYMAGVAWQLAHKENCGLILKAASDSTSIYFGAVNRSGGAINFTDGDTTLLHFKFGVVKD